MGLVSATYQGRPVYKTRQSPFKLVYSILTFSLISSNECHSCESFEVIDSFLLKEENGSVVCFNFYVLKLVIPFYFLREDQGSIHL